MKNSIPLMAALLIASLPMVAQFQGPPGGFGPGGPHGFPGFRPGKVVTGAPYSATVTNTVLEQLAGGNSIQRTTTGQVARDSQGRTYEQLTINGGPLAQNGPKTLIFINDPVAGYSYVLNADSKTADRHVLHQRQGNGSEPNANWQKHQPDFSNVVQADLPADNSSGVTAQGKSITRTIPAGAIGNAKDIVVANQTWYSTDLQIVVKSIRNDPRFGQTTYALTNISTKDPDPSLFQVPAGYTVRDAPTHGSRAAHVPPPPPGI